MIACMYVQPCWATQSFVMSMCQSSSGRVTWKKPGRCSPTRVAGRLQQLVLAHDPLHPLAIHRLTLSSRVASAATIRVPSVGLALGDLDDCRIRVSETLGPGLLGDWSASGERGRSPGVEMPATRATTEGRRP